RRVLAGGSQAAPVCRLGQGREQTAALADAGEKRRLLPELLLGPAGKGVVVALGTLQADPEEGAAHGGGEVLRASTLAGDEGQRVGPLGRTQDRLALFAGRDWDGEEVAHQAVVARAGAEALDEPVLEAGLEQRGLAVGGDLGHQVGPPDV